MKMKKLLVVLLAICMIFTVVGCNNSPNSEGEENKEPNPQTEPSPGADTPKGNPNLADFKPFSDQNWDINKYYKDLDVDADVVYTATGGVVNVPDTMTTEIPKANKKYKIGFSVYYTVDEVGAMILDSMKETAEKCGVELLVNDANYDQNLQNQAIEQWIVEGVDGVILAPCDFYSVKGALDSLKNAGIPVVTLNPALEGEASSVVMSECTEQGSMAAQILIDELKAQNSNMEGVVVLQTLPFVHPNAATRAKGFKDAFKDYPGIEIVDLNGTAPEEHYTAFEGALQKYGDKLIGGFGLYASATIGMMNAKKAANSKVPITSIDNDKVILEGIYKGDLLGSACYSSTSPSLWTMTQMVNLLNGEEIPRAMFYPNTIVTKDNVEEMFSFYYGADKTLEAYMAGQID